MEGIAREALRQHAVKRDEAALGIVAAQRV
jgi:hypothetical protein